MDAVTIAQIASPIINFIFVLVLAGGYYFLVKATRDSLEETRASRIAGGRPQVIVNIDTSDLPAVGIVVRNVSQGAAKDIFFEFSESMENSDGIVISELPYFKNGVSFLEPGGEISSYWDSIDAIKEQFQEKGLAAKGITVTTRYKDLHGELYKSDWTINPLLYADNKRIENKGMEDLVNAVEKISKDVERLANSLDRERLDKNGDQNSRNRAQENADTRQAMPEKHT